MNSFVKKITDLPAVRKVKTVLENQQRGVVAWPLLMLGFLGVIAQQWPIAIAMAAAPFVIVGAVELGMKAGEAIRNTFKSKPAETPAASGATAEAPFALPEPCKDAFCTASSPATETATVPDTGARWNLIRGLN